MNNNQGQSDKYLIKLCESKEQLHLDLIKQKLSDYCKYFFDWRSSTLLIYDRTSVFIVSKQETKITDLGKIHPISQMVYNPFRNVLIFLNFDGELYGHFMSHKTQIIIKKHVKSQIIFDWVYGREGIVDFFIAESSGVKMYKMDDEKKSFKEVKSVSAKYNSFLYDPFSQVLVGFPVGDCRNVYTFNFDDESKAKNWFKGPQIPINFENDQFLLAKAKKQKNLGFKNCRIHCQLFTKPTHEDHTAELIRMNNKSYLILYFSNQGKLKLYPIGEQFQKQISIKLPSDSVPIIHVVDNMLVIHLRNEKITFLYDILNGNAQMLVSPFPVEHRTRKDENLYEGAFCGRRHILTNGVISRWVINIPVIHFYLKNELQIFQFLIRRRGSKSETLRWLRQNLFTFKQVNLSKFWKLLFVKYLSPENQHIDDINLIELYANIFYTIAQDELVGRSQILAIILECVRQANQLQIKVPFDLQKLIVQLLLVCRKYEMLVFLSHNDVIKDCEEFADLLIQKGKKQKEQILITLAIDMANRSCKSQKVFELLMLTEKVWEARRYLKMNYEHIDVLFMIYAAKFISDTKTKRQYLKMTKLFIHKKFPAITEKYLDEAQESVKIQGGAEIVRQSLR